MSEGLQDDIQQGLRKIGATYSSTDEKQQQMVQMIKRYEVKPQLSCRINQDIQGLRKKRIPFGAKPNNRRLWQTWASFERNGMINIGLSRNWARVMYPVVPAFFFFYICQPIVHGTIYIQQYDNYQWESLYYKFTMNRVLFTDQTITRLA